MKEQIYTIPLMDAYRADEECPFCFIERNLEQHSINFTLGPGASYMEDDIRAQTDEAGFCKEHYRQMFVYGNRLGSALILETHLRKKAAELKQEMKQYSGKSKGIMGRFRKGNDSEESSNNVSRWVQAHKKSCYICDHIKSNYDRYMATFFELFKKGDPEFIGLVKNCKGYCLPHFGDILEYAPQYLNEKDQAKLREILFPQMEQNLDRIIEDVDWFQKKFDYLYKDADWKKFQRCRTARHAESRKRLPGRSAI